MQTDAKQKRMLQIISARQKHSYSLLPLKGSSYSRTLSLSTGNRKNAAAKKCPPAEAGGHLHVQEFANDQCVHGERRFK